MGGGREAVGPDEVGRYFSNLSVHPNHLVGLVKQIAAPTPPETWIQ